MSITGFLSIWISNTATTSMVLPIVISIVKELVKINPLFSKQSGNLKENKEYKYSIYIKLIPY